MAPSRQGFTVTNHLSLANLGWQPFFQQQIDLEEWEAVVPARIFEQHKSFIEVETEAGRKTLPIVSAIPPITVGDWVLLNCDSRISRVLERKSCFQRKAAGSKISEQLIAANVDTAFIICSLNEDFNLNRIERYLSIVNEAGSDAVVVLSKMDLCSGPDTLREQVQELDRSLCVEMINCLDTASASVLLPWCQPGRTVVMLGSSGSGKSTLSNRLLGENIQATGEIREDDAKGRHTTTRRSLLAIPSGALILDTPGMRELQLVACEEGVTATFADIEELSKSCRFSDCQHGNEPGCVVRKAIESGELDKRRFSNYQKLLREQALNSASLAERRVSDRNLTQYHKRVQREAKKIKRG